MNRMIENILADKGYNFVVSPSESIKPLLLLFKNKDGVSSTDSMLTKIFPAVDIFPPQVSKNKKVQDISQNSKVSYEFSAGVNVLESLLKKLNLGNAGANTDLDKQVTVNVVYENILRDYVSFVDLDQYISGTSPSDEKMNASREKLEDSELYVITEVLKSKSYSATVESGDAQSAKIEATLKGILDADANWKREKDNSLSMKYEAENPLVFAFKAVQIIYDSNKFWQFFGGKKEVTFKISNQQGLVLKGEEDFPVRMLEVQGGLVEL